MMTIRNELQRFIELNQQERWVPADIALAHAEDFIADQ
jgi:hypothetical protein